MKIWIDFSNSPHPLLFAPVAALLERGGHEVLVTARDNAQTVELTLERWPSAEIIGGESPRLRRAKVVAIKDRIAHLRRWAKTAKPDVALSHNSYAQIVAAWSLRIPAVTAMDFEHQPANHLAFRLAHTVLVPEVLPVSTIHRQGARARKLVRYPGLKEELYVGDFHPDAQILTNLGLAPRPETLVVARTPPTRAVYHPSSNPLFEEVLRTTCARAGVICVVLTRHREQIAAIDALGLKNCVIPRNAVDSRSLLYSADAMIGAGGTMTREAALLGIPTWTLFAGSQPAVDSWLEREGRLSRLTDTSQLASVGPRRSEPCRPDELRQRATALARLFVGATLAARVAA